MMEYLLYLLVGFAAFLLYFGLTVLLRLRSQKTATPKGSFPQTGFYPVFAWFRVVVIIVTIVIAGMTYHMYYTNRERDDVWLAVLTVFGPILFGMMPLALIWAFRSYVEIKDEIFYYHNGFRLRAIRFEDLINCEADAASEIVITYKQKPKRPLRIAPYYKNYKECFGILEEYLNARRIKRYHTV